MLTKEQIEYLFVFCRKHFVKYYDVQIELVDHLANAVELEMKKDSKLTLEKAVENVHAGFGVMGFAPLVAEKQKMAAKQSRKLFFELFKEQFRWPKILLFFVLTTGFYSLFSLNLISTIFVFFCIIVLSFIFYFLAMFQLQIVTKRTGKKFLLIDFSWISSVILIPGYSANSFRILIEKTSSLFSISSFSNFSFSLFFSIYILLILVSVQTVLSIRNKLQEQYPQAFAVKE